MLAEYTHDEHYNMLSVPVLIEMVLMHVTIHLLYSTQGTDTRQWKCRNFSCRMTAADNITRNLGLLTHPTVLKVLRDD